MAAAGRKVRFEVFKAGRHVSGAGSVHEYGESELAQMASVYDPAKHHAPVVIGHPKTNAPAYGWVDKFFVNSAGRLEAECSDVHEDFAESVRAGHYRTRSLSLYPPAAPNNPAPGQWYPRHVGFLGAEAPAIKGLKAVQFSEEDDGSILVEFRDWDDLTVARLFRGIREWLLEKFGQEEADRALPPWEVDSVQENAAAKPDAAPSNYSENDTQIEERAGETATEPPGPTANAVLSPAAESGQGEPTKPASSEAAAPTTASPPPADDSADEKLTERERLIKQREEELGKTEREKRVQSYRDLCQALVKDGRPLPCKEEFIVSFCELLHSADTATVDFGEGEERSAVELFQVEFLKRLPKRVEYREMGAGDPDDGEAPTATQLAERVVEFKESLPNQGQGLSTSQVFELYHQKQ